MVKKSLIFLFCFLFLISFTSAFEFDNVKSYDPITKEVTITNALGLGEVIGTAKLNTPLNVIVGQGYQKVAEFNIWAYDDYNDAIKQFTFKDMKNGKEKINRDYDLRYKTTKTITVNDYNYTYDKYTETYDRVKIGEHEEEIEDWAKITPADLKKNEVLTVGIFTNVQKGDFIDWIPTIYGVEIEEWATWTEALNADLDSYYKMDDDAANTLVLDSIQVNNGTASANTDTLSVAGKISTALELNSISDYVSIGGATTSPFDFSDNFSVSFWIYPNALLDNYRVMGNNVDGTSGGWLMQLYTDGSLYYIENDDGSNFPQVKSAASEITTGSFQHVVFVKTGTTGRWYIDGSETGSYQLQQTLLTSIYPSTKQFQIASLLAPGGNYPLDEIGLWSRALTTSEITQLYNGGTGITWSGTFGTAPSVTLISPVDFANLTSGDIDFIANATDDVEVANVTLYIDGVLNETNSSGVNGTYTFSKILAEGIHNWSILVVDNQSLENQSETRTLNYTFPVIPPEITLISPADFANLTSANVAFISTVTDNIEVANVTLYIDGVLNETNSSGVNGTYTFNKIMSEGIHVWSILAYDSNSFSTQSENRSFNYTQPPIFIDLLSPADLATFDIPLVNMSCKAYEQFGILGLNLTINGVVNISLTNTSIGENLSISQEMNFSEDNYTWGCSALSTMSLAASSNRTFEVLYAESDIELSIPLNDSSINSNLINFSFNASNINGLSSVTLYIDGVANETNSSGLDGNYTFNVYLDEDNYTWNIVAVSLLSTVTNSTSRTFEVLFTSPVISNVSPTNDSTVFVNDVYFNFSATDSNGIDNVTLYIDGVLNETNSSGVNGTYSFYRNLSDGNYNWSIIAVSIYDKETTIGNYLLDVHTTGPIVNVFYPSGTLDFTEPGTNLTLNYSVGGDNVTNCWYEYGEDGYCFQESLNISNQTGLDGDCGLNYTGEISIYNVGSTHVGYYNYTKPSNATSSRWQIRYGIENFVNVTIPTSCYYNNNDYLELSIDQNTNFKFFSANCYDGNSWTEIYRESLPSAEGGFTFTTNTSIFNDGDYTTGGVFTNPIRIITFGNLLTYQLYEEAMYWNIGTQLNCSETLDNFTYEFGYNNLTVSALDALGALSSNTTTWDYLFENWDIGLVTPQYEGTQGVFTLNTTLKTGELIEQAIFEYNGTNYTTSIIASGSDYIIVASIALPSVENDTNFTLSFYVVVDGITYNFEEETQEVLNIGFITCVDDQDLLINLSLFDEGSRAELFGDVEFNMQAHSKTSDGIVAEINGTYENISNQEICLSPNASFPLLYLNAEFRYFKDGYATEFYHIQKSDLTDYPIDLDLFSLNQNDSTEFTVTYKNNDFIFTEGAVIQLQRKYVGEDIYRVVEAPVTGDGGTAILHIDLNTNKYQATVVKDGELLDVFPNIVFSCDNELSGDCSHSLDGTVDPNNDVSITEITDFAYSVSVDEGNQTITVLFAVPSGTPATINVVLEQIDMFGNLTSCNTTLVTSAGSITCDYTDTIEKSILELSISKNSVELAILSYVNDPQLDMDGINFFIIFLFMISIVGMAIASPEWMVIISVMVLVIGGTLLLVNGMNLVVGLGALAWVIVAAAIIIFKMAKQEDR